MNDLDVLLTNMEAAAAAVTRARDQIENAKTPGQKYFAWRAMEAALFAHANAIGAWLLVIKPMVDTALVPEGGDR